MLKFKPHGRVPVGDPRDQQSLNVSNIRRTIKKTTPVDPHAPIPVTANATSPSPPPTALTPAKFRTAYKIPNSATGVGATIGIIDIMPISSYTPAKIISDYNAFCAQYSLPNKGLKIYTYPPNSPPSASPNVSGWGMEASLDIQWAHVVAPQANIILMLVAQPAASTFAGIAAAINATIALGAQIISMSFGTTEMRNQLLLGLEPVFQNNKVTFIASAGDIGGELCYPAASQYVISVGGTSLGTKSSGDYVAECGWISSGGGVSQYVRYPTYQTFANLFQTAQTGRCIPDVALVGDPYTGVAVYCTEYGTSTPWYQVGGTSLGAPAWAGVCALLYQKFGPSSLGTANLQNTLYTIYKNPTLYATCFNDVLIGQSVDVQNGTLVVENACKSGYDLISGIGTPNVGQILNLSVLPKSVIQK